MTYKIQKNSGDYKFSPNKELLNIKIDTKKKKTG